MTRKPNQPRKQPGTQGMAVNRPGLSGVDVAYWLTVAFVLFASLFPQEPLWGINWYGYFPWSWRIAAAVVAIVGWVIAKRLKFSAGDTAPGNSGRYYAIAGLIVVVTGALFVLLNVATHFLGDGYQTIANLYTNKGYVRLWHAAPYVLQEAVYSLFSAKTEDTARAAVQWVSYASGWVFLIAVAWAARSLFEKNRQAILFLLGVASAGYVLMFFGYSENYPPFTAVVTILCLLGTLAALGKVSRWWVIPLWILAFLLHVFAVVLLPAVLYLLVVDTPLGRRINELSRTVKIRVAVALLVVAAIGFVYAYTQFYFFRFAITPFIPDRFTVEHYHLFSGKHILDCLNELLVVLPSAAVLLTGVLATGLLKATARKDILFLSLATAGPLLLMLILYPRLGMPRDWDLFSLFGVPMAILCYYIILGGGTDRNARPVTAILSIVLCVLVFVPRLATQRDAETSIAVFDNYANLDVIRNYTGRFVLIQFLEKHGRSDEALWRGEQNKRDLPHEVWVLEGQDAEARGDTATATALFRRAIQADPQNAFGWLDLGVMLLRKEQYDSARACIEIANGINPDNCSIVSNLGSVFYETDHKEHAVELWKRACELDPDDFIPRSCLLRHYITARLDAEFTVLLSQCQARTNGSAAYDRGLGDFLIEGEQFETAAQVFRRALSKGLDSSYVRGLDQKYPDLHALD